MTVIKLSVLELELLRVLRDGDPDQRFSVNDEEFAAEPVDGYLWETLADRARTEGDIGDGVVRLVKDGLLRFVNASPGLVEWIFGKRAVKYGYLTILGREAAASPASYLGKPLDCDDQANEHEPKGMWLRQISGLPPLSE